MALFVLGVLCNCAKHNSRETVQRASDSARAFIFHQPNLPISKTFPFRRQNEQEKKIMNRFLHCCCKSLHRISAARAGLLNSGKDERRWLNTLCSISELCKTFLSSCIFFFLLQCWMPDSHKVQANRAEVDGWCVCVGIEDNNPSPIDSGRIACRQEAVQRRLCVSEKSYTASWQSPFFCHWCLFIVLSKGTAKQIRPTAFKD